MAALARAAPAAGPPVYCVALVILTMLCVTPLRAAQIDFGAVYRAEYSDNINRVHDLAARVPDLVNSAAVNLSLVENSGSLVARVVGGATYNNYYHDSFSDQTNFTLDAYAEAYMYERVFSWVVQDGFRQMIADSLVADTPANRTDTNSWQTGPNAYLRFGPVDTLLLEGRYGQTWVDSPQLRYQRQSYASRWLHRTSPRTVISANYEWLFLNYDYIDPEYAVSEPYPDLTRRRLYLRAEYRDAGNQMSANLGWTQVNQYGRESNSIPLLHLALTRQPSSTSNYGLRYRYEYSDIGGELLPSVSFLTSPVGAADITTAGLNTVSQDPFALRQVDLFHNRTGGAFLLALQVFYRDLDFLSEPDDREETGAMGNLRYGLTATTAIEIQGAYLRSIYWQQRHATTDLNRKDRDSNVGVILSYRLTPRLRVGLEARRFERRTTWTEQGYTDDRFALSLTYQSRPAAH